MESLQNHPRARSFGSRRARGSGRCRPLEQNPWSIAGVATPVTADLDPVTCRRNRRRLDEPASLPITENNRHVTLVYELTFIIR